MRKKRDEKEKFITIKEVAKEADVSIATVSRVINSGSVRAEKKKRVLDAIHKLNYVPNESARNLAAVSVTKRIAFLLPGFDNFYYLEMIKGCKDILSTYLYDVLINTYDYSDEKYQTIHRRYELSGEYKAVIQLGNYNEYDNKFAIDWGNENIVYKKNKLTKTISIYTKDKYFKKFLKDSFLENLKDYDEKKVTDLYLAPSVDEALHLYNLGVKENPICTFGDVEEIQKLCPNIKKLEVDFYGLGVAMARIAVKLTRKESINKVRFVLKGIEEEE